MTAFTPTVSVIVPVYNGADTIGRCVESLLEQTYPWEAYEIIIVENNSTDATTAIVERYPVRLVHTPKKGPARARNFGLAHSQADIVAFTDADCIAHPDWLAELVKPYTDPGTGGVGGAILAHEHPDRTLVELFSDDHSPLVNFVSGEDEFLPHLYTANASYRRSLVNQIGGFNAALITGDDVDLAWRLQLHTATRLDYNPRAIIYHHHRASRSGLARQYRQYGFGEILLDTLYSQYPGYPRNRAFQVRRLLAQATALPRYAASAVRRRLRLAAGRATPYEATVPRLWFLIESSNIRGKLEGMLATRFMTDAQPALDFEAQVLISRLFPDGKQ